MKKYFFYTLLIFVPATSLAFSLEDSVIRLLCPQRGNIDVILHRYEHTQEAWGNDRFETGGGHSRKGSLLLFQFANLDQMIFNQATGAFSFWYADTRSLVSCRLLSLTHTHPVTPPYYRE